MLKPGGDRDDSHRHPRAGPGGVLRMTWVQDQLAHVLDHSDADEPSGTWTGLACPDHGLALGADVDAAHAAAAAAGVPDSPT